MLTFLVDDKKIISHYSLDDFSLNFNFNILPIFSNLMKRWHCGIQLLLDVIQSGNNASLFQNRCTFTGNKIIGLNGFPDLCQLKSWVDKRKILKGMTHGLKWEKLIFTIAMFTLTKAFVI